MPIRNYPPNFENLVLLGKVPSKEENAVRGLSPPPGPWSRLRGNGPREALGRAIASPGRGHKNILDVEDDAVGEGHISNELG